MLKSQPRLYAHQLLVRTMRVFHNIALVATSQIGSRQPGMPEVTVPAFAVANVISVFSMIKG